MSWPIGFLTFGSVFNNFFNVQLNYSHGEMPQGLYGVVVDCFTTKILHSCLMIFLLKLLSWLLCIPDGIP